MTIKLISTGEILRPLTLGTDRVNGCLAKYGKKAHLDMLIPVGKVMLAEYRHFMLENGSIQLIHIRNTRSQTP